jgi:biopolymer transport protein ExbD
MAGGGSPTPNKSGKRNVDFTVNLVPFIDLLSVLISFLLITAVWTQLARINANQMLPKTSDQPVEDNQEKEQILRVLVAEQQTIVQYGEDPQITIAADDSEVVKLGETIKGLKAKIADPKKQKVQIGAYDQVHYSKVIQVMDVMLDNELTGLSVGGAEILKGMMPEGATPPGGAPGGAAPAPGQPG